MKTASITVSRNDGYKEKERFATHLNTLLETFDEVNYVDWNSPSGSFLYEVIDMVPKTGRIKHFVIPPHVHDLFAQAVPEFPNVYDALAPNIALKRTDADWVVVTTSDIIPPFKNEFINFLNQCNEDTFYTISRREIEYADVVKNLNNINKHREYLNQTSKPRYFPGKVSPNDEYSIINCCGDFQLAHKNVWNKVKGFEEHMFYKCFVDTNVQKKAVLNGYKLEAIYDLPVYHMSHDNILPQAHTTKLHNVADKKPAKYNDAWDWVEVFTESKNSLDWGLGDTEIEFEIY